MVSISSLVASSFLVASLISTADAFATPAIILTSPTRGAPLGASSSDPTEILSDYMTKSHEEKLRAIKSVEDQKNMEISVLKAEIERLKSASSSELSVATSAVASPSPPLTSNLDYNNMDIAAMQSKLASYQAFMEEYIVDSQNQKLAAVKEAESRVEKKFMDMIEKLLLDESSVNGSADSSSPAVVATTAATVGEQSLFQKRNIQITQAANANKSRWGSMEIERAKDQLLVQPPPSAAAASATTTVASTATLFDRRNAQVVASAAAGKSRWGGMEVERAMKNGVVVADGGSSASGSSGGSAERTTNAVISLEERVNLGARLLGA
ncbi:hypothetical protein ACHAXH_007517 [Discostella pseudostelligera]